VKALQVPRPLRSSSACADIIARWVCRAIGPTAPAFRYAECSRTG
jgi:hypothetical protein